MWTRVVALLLLVAVWASAAGQEFDYEAYRPAMLAKVEAGLPAHPSDWLAEGQSRFRTQATFTGGIRPLAKDRRQYIAAWAQAMGHPVDTAKVFEREIEVLQGDIHYWMPIQQVLVGQLQSEVPRGAPVELYVLLMGTQRGVLVFTVNEFDAQADAHAPAPEGGSVPP